MIEIISNPVDTRLLGQAVLAIGGNIICVTFDEVYSNSSDKNMFVLKAHGRTVAFVRMEGKQDLEIIERFRKQDEAPQAGADSSL